MFDIPPDNGDISMLFLCFVILVWRLLDNETERLGVGFAALYEYRS